RRHAHRLRAVPAVPGPSRHPHRPRLVPTAPVKLRVLSREGLAAAWTKGSVSGRRPRLTQLGVVDQVRQAFRDGASIAALAREHGVSRGAIRTAVADLLPNQPDRPAPAATSAPQAIRVEIPAKNP